MTCANAVGESQFKITTRRDNDKVESEVDKDGASFSVHSPFGISQAVLQRNDKDWPDVVTLRLYLKGLENFKVTNGKVTLEAAVSSHGDDHPVRLWLDEKKDSRLYAKSPYWIEIRMVGNDGEPAKTIPLIDGYFEMRLPTALFEENPKSITISWIDFYR